MIKFVLMSNDTSNNGGAHHKECLDSCGKKFWDL